MNDRLVHLGLLAHTARHVRPAQVLHRLRLRGQRRVVGLVGERAAPMLRRRVGGGVGWPDDFAALDRTLTDGAPSPEHNAAGTFRFLAVTHQLGDPRSWEPPELPQLWRYHLHYFEWAWPFVTHPDRNWASAAFAGLWQSWRRGTRFGRWDAWSPYCVSLRSWVWCDVFRELVAGTPIESAFVDDLALHAGYLTHNLEFDVGGNHLVKNLKALIGLGVFLGDEALTARGLRHLERAVQRQVLVDGGHEERSPSYHAQVLGDLVDVSGLLAAANGPDGSPPWLDDTIGAMRRWLGNLVLPDGDVALFNDAVDVGGDRLDRLGIEGAAGDRLVVLEPSGYVVAQLGPWHLVVDVGLPCPDDLPAHAHADTLSFVLSHAGRRVVVDTGVSEYGTGPRRAYERSTRAHNTVEIDGVDSTEVWGAFRAARRARPALHRAARTGDTIEIAASHDGYRRLDDPVGHRRRFVLSRSGLVVEDLLDGTGTHRVVASVHLAAGSEEHLTVRMEVTDDAGADLQVTTEPVSVARHFGVLEPATVIRGAGDLPLPARLRTVISAAEVS